MTTATPLRPLVDALEGMSSLDPIGKKIGKFARDTFAQGQVKEAISGSWFGHAVHPPLTDVVIGTTLSASLLDLLGGDERDARRLLGVGLLAGLPTALSGWNDWADSEIADEAVRRVGLVHASANLSAVALYAASLAARRRGSRGLGTAFGLLGNAVMTVGGYLGGHMSYTRGVGPNQTAFDAGPEDWTAVGDGKSFPDGELRAVLAGDTPVLVVRSGNALRAIHNRCSHRGCMLSDGELEGNIVTCACHGSRFDLGDGSVVRGPATAGQPAFDVRESDEKVQVRLRHRG